MLQRSGRLLKLTWFPMIPNYLHWSIVYFCSESSRYWTKKPFKQFPTVLILDTHKCQHCCNSYGLLPHLCRLVMVYVSLQRRSCSGLIRRLLVNDCINFKTLGQQIEHPHRALFGRHETPSKLGIYSFWSYPYLTYDERSYVKNLWRFYGFCMLKMECRVNLVDAIRY